MSARTDLISVVIPTHNRCASLRRMLDALCRQDFPAQQLEVIVVLDGCRDGTRAMLQEYSTPFRLLMIEQEQGGPAAARNHGAVKASGRLLIFLDDDVIPSTGCVTAHVAAHGGHTDHVVVGPYLPALRAKADYAEMDLRVWWHDKFRAMRHPAHRFSYEDFLSGNCSICRDLFTRVGGFDPTFPCAHEDYELGIRLLKAGATLRYSSVPYATHDITASSTVPQMVLRKMREAQADVLLGIRHPELRHILPLVTYGQPHTRLGRLMQYLAFSQPKIGDAAAALLGAILEMLQRLQLRRRWQWLYGGFLRYWYLRSLADTLVTNAALLTFLDDRLPNPTKENEEELQVDLSQGIEYATQQVDHHRPLGVRLVIGEHVIGRIAPQPGRERLRGIHLKNILATDFLWSLFTAVVQRTGLERHPFPPTTHPSEVVTLSEP